jgi:hypothetical protein
MLNLTRLHLGIAHESQFQGLGISQDILTRPYQAHFGFFLAGLLALGALVVIAAFGVRESGSGEDT